MNLLGFRDGIRTNYWFYSVYCEERYKSSRDDIIQKLKENKIQARPIWGLISEQKPYIGSREYKIEKANDYWRRVVNVPCSTNLTSDDVDEIVSLL